MESYGDGWLEPGITMDTSQRSSMSSATTRRLALALARAPEFAIVRWGFPLNAAWEFAHSPLYADWNREWTYLLWTRLHCTVGDVMILLGAFWLTSLVFGTRHWIGTTRSASWLFVISGVGYTAWSEWYNVSIRASWGYDATMPVIVGIGLAPLVQWMLVPPLTLWLLRKCGSLEHGGV